MPNKGLLSNMRSVTGARSRWRTRFSERVRKPLHGIIEAQPALARTSRLFLESLTVQERRGYGEWYDRLDKALGRIVSGALDTVASDDVPANQGAADLIEEGIDDLLEALTLAEKPLFRCGRGLYARWRRYGDTAVSDPLEQAIGPWLVEVQTSIDGLRRLAELLRVWVRKVVWEQETGDLIPDLGAEARRSLRRRHGFVRVSPIDVHELDVALMVRLGLLESEDATNEEIDAAVAAYLRYCLHRDTDPEYFLNVQYVDRSSGPGILGAESPPAGPANKLVKSGEPASRRVNLK